MRPYTKPETWLAMADDIADPSLRGEFKDALQASVGARTADKGVGVPLILLPHAEGDPSHADTEFTAEFEAARAVGFQIVFYDHTAATQGDAEGAVSAIPATTAKRSLILRGWMLPGERYAALDEALKNRGYSLLTNPGAYVEAHYVPLSYRLIADYAPRTAWMEGDDEEAAWELYQGFRSKDAVIKDWVKSAKTRWPEGCFLPAGCSPRKFRETFRIFRAERGRLFNRGVVLREFLPIVERGGQVGGLPAIDEFRRFLWHERLVNPLPSANPSFQAVLAVWESVARRFASPFITIDVGRLQDGAWRIIEVGDGGVSGLPPGQDPWMFFAALWNRITADND